MKYDMIVVGGGPGGLVAARTAAEAGMKVLLIERKKVLTRITRACLQYFYLQWVCPDGYLEPTSVELLSDSRVRFNLLGVGCSVNYRGPLKPLTNTIYLSPNGVEVRHFNNDNFGFFYDKQTLLKGLLNEARKAGAEIVTGTIAQAARNIPNGVQLSIRDQSGERNLEARHIIAADGINSLIVDSLGLNQQRKIINPNYALPMYVMEDVHPDVFGHETAWVHVHLPNLAETGFRLGSWKGETKWVHGDWQNLEKYPRYAAWFKNARLIKKYAFSQIMRTSLRDPVCENVIVVGDAGATTETWIQGAMASGYQAVKSILEELNGRNGYAAYRAWWLKAFYFNDPGYIKRVIALLAINRVCNEEETDYLFQLVKDRQQMPHFAVVTNLDLLKANRPELYEKINGFMGKMYARLQSVLDAYPPDSNIYPEPNAYAGRWRV